MSPPKPIAEADCGRSLPSLLLPWLEQNPHAPALLHQGEVWSRALLDQVAHAWAVALHQQGVAAGDVVGLAVARGPERVAAVLATLKLGAACLPLDPSYPQARLEMMLAEAGPKCLLLSASEEGRFLGSAVPQLCAEELARESSVELPELQADTSEEVAYLMYTSGSTGRPKGVAMPHRPLCNLMAWQDRDSGLEEGARTLQFAPLSFDVSFQEIFATLGSGGTLVLMEEDDRLDSLRLAELLTHQNIARLFLPAVALQELANAAMAAGLFPSSLREVITAGEQLVMTPSLRSWFQGLPETRLVNQYGPSETHVATAYTLVGDAKSWPELPPIGKAISGVKTLVLQEDGSETPVGEAGELWLGGRAPALGYWQQPELSAERFTTLAEHGDGLWYRSGDQVVQDSDGNLHFQGRDDEQIKLRGYRIELGEIEACLASARGVGQVAVAKKDGPTGPRLIAYVVAQERDTLRMAALRRHVAAQLPEYMVPSSIMELDSLPRTPSGKLARRELPLPDHQRPAQDHPLIPTATEDEAAAAKVWCEVLALEEVGVEDNFFALGGDSLACVRMAARLSQQLGREVPVTAPFRAPTIRTLLATLNDQGAATPKRARRSNSQLQENEGIAIVGMHMQVPGANQLDQFWDLLQSGEDAIRHFSEEEMRAAGVAEELLQDPDYVRARGQIDQPTAFDATLFGVSPREAILMDPQQRLFLQGCWAALEHAGYAPRSVPGAVGVWGGISTGMANSTYLLRVLHARPGALGCADTLTAMLGNQNDYLCTRVSHLLDLHGPSVSVQTACSTSLVAIAEAVQSLRAGRCDMALAGGASVLFPQNQGYLHQEGDISSSDGRCRPFDRQADGTLFGDGVGVVALKRLQDAQADGDPIHAVIRGVGINNDGGARMSFSAPSASGQAEVLALALEDAGWDPASVGMIEAHGTATPIGDPIEVDGLRQVYGHLPPSSCALGSVKSQLGHLIAAAGVSGLIKTVLALKHAEVPPTAHFAEAHPDLSLEQSPFYVTGQGGPWPEKSGPRRAGVSAFGLGGTNAHVLLEQAPPQAVVEIEESVDAPAQLFPLSAASASALSEQATALANYLEEHSDVALADVAKTLQQGREVMAHRAVVAAETLDRAIEALRSPQLPRQSARPAVAEAAFLFPGGGAQYHDMGRGLLAQDGIVRETIEQGLAWLTQHQGPDLGRLWWPGEASLSAQEAEALWQKPSWQLPAIYLLEVAVARLWQEQGLQPKAMLGHSMGEYAAACLAGIMTLEEGLGLVLLRGQLFEQLPEGAMLSVALSEAELRAQLGEELDLAVVNGSELCLASGPVHALAALQTQLEEQGVDVARVRIDVAAHSQMVEQILPAFRSYLEQLDLQAPQIPIASNLSGTWLTAEEACSAEYWVRHLRETVRFADGLALVAQDRSCQLIEVGPGRTLSSLARPALDVPAGQVTWASLRHAEEERSDAVVWQEALGRAWCAGLDVDWSRSTAASAKRIPLPTYSFEKTEYFFVDPLAGSAEAAPAVEVDGLAAEESSAPAFDPDMPRLERIQIRLAQILGQLSGHDPASMDPEQPFLEMGFDSLFLTQASLAFKRAFQVRITFRQLFNDAPALTSLAAYIDSQLEEGVEVEMPEASLAAASGESVAAGEAMVLPALHPEGADPGDQVWRFRPFTPVERGDDGGLAKQQQTHLAKLIQAVNQKTPGSKRVTAAHRKTLADPRAVGGFKTMWKEIVYPLAVDRSKGAYMWDIDGNEYVDAVGGFGAVLFGHAPDFVVDAVREQAANNLDYGPTMELAGQLTDRLCAMTGMERASFCNTGSEAVMAAMRVARTATGKDRIATFSGDYHGLFDEVLVRAQEAAGKRKNIPVAPGIPQGSNTNMMVLEYGLPASLELIRAHADDLAGVLVEPVQSRAPELQPHAFVKQLRELTKELGIPLIFDEIITGFRTHPRGAQAYYGIQADIAAYGKVIGGGIPIGVVAGKAEYLDAMDGGYWEYGDDSFPEAGVTYFAGTFVRHPLALAAMNAVMDRLEEGGEELQQGLNDRIAIFAAACNDDFEAANLPLRMLHFASMVYPKWGGDPEFESLWFQHMRLRGLHAWEGRPGFLTTEHGQEELDFMRRVFVEAAEAMVEGGFLHCDETPTREEQLIPLTGPQEELWLTTRASEEASKALNEPCSFRLEGRVNIPVLERALRKLVERHDGLRAAAAPDGSGLRVLPEVEAPAIVHHDLRRLPSAELAAQREDIYRIDSREFFDLEKPPLLRVSLLQLGDEEYELLLTVHHLVADGWSISILFHDLAQFYSRMMQGRNEELGEAMPLAEFQAWDAEQKSSEEHAETLAFWRERFATLPENLDLPLDRPRPERRSYGGDRQFRHIDAAIGRALQEQATAQKCTLFSLLLAGYFSFLHRLTGQTDMVVGIPSAGQALLGANNLVAHCVHYLPFRMQVRPEESFASLTARVAEEMLAVNEHQDFTFGDLLQELRMPRDATRPTLLAVDFNVDPALEGMDFHGLKSQYISTPRDFARLELQLNVIEDQGTLLLECDHATDILDHATASHWMDAYESLLKCIAQNPDTKVGELPAARSAQAAASTEKQGHSLYAPQDFGAFQNVADMVSQQAARRGEAIALVDGERQLSYSELDRQAEAFAHQLYAQGLRKGDVVALHLGRSAELTLAQLALWKLGGVCLALDPSHPLARREELLQQSACKLILHGSEAPPESSLAFVSALPIAMDAPSVQGVAPWEAVTAEDPAYILFTSGSTGKPKGVVLGHGGFHNLLCAFAERPGAKEEETWLAVITPTFDMSLVEVFVPLTVGARVVLTPGDQVLGGPELLAMIREHDIDVIQATPANWRMLLEAGLAPEDQLRIVTGGEALTPALAAQLLPCARELWNAYGPTETTVYACAAKIEQPLEEIPIGSPIHNLGLHILDSNDQAVAPGEVGELCISGPALAQHYLHLEEETASKFPTLLLDGEERRIYRSGDLARWNPQGQVQCLGRNDDQIKLRGFRVECGEVEAALETLPAVAQAAVALRQDESGDDLLVAWLRPVGQALPSAMELRGSLATKLPTYMLPSRFLQVSALPLSDSGKVQRSALTLPRQEESVSEDAGQNAESFLQQIWASMLGLPEVDLDDDFFMLGGHSLLAARMLARVEDRYGLLLALEEVFRQPTIRGLAAVIEATLYQQQNQSDGQDGDREELRL